MHDTRLRLWTTRAAALVIAMCLTACKAAPQDAADTAVVSFSAARIRLVSGKDTTTLRVELAKTSTQQTMGLMERTHLADSAGMLFLYGTQQPANAGFWMFRTRIPLDIAYLDSLGKILTVVRMPPCTSTLVAGCGSYPPGMPYRAALEVNAGFFEKHNIVLGARLILNDTARVVAPLRARNPP